MAVETKMLKARCKKTGRYYGLEIKQFGSSWRVVNMVHLSDEERRIISSEVRQFAFDTNDNLIPCTKCGNRRVGGCSCARSMYQCSEKMKYQFNCVYCDSLEIDYSRSSYSGPYTKWAGTSNIPDAIKDRYGNPQGSQYDLAQDGSFTGYKVIVLNLCNECDFTEPRKALMKKGFEVIEHKKLPNAWALKSVLSDHKSQLWIVSHKIAYMTPAHIEIIKKYFISGHGVYIWGDNDPYYADANQLLESIFGLRMHGDSRGDKVLGIQQKTGMPGIIPNHPITTGIMNFYEGITIAEVETKPSTTQPLQLLFNISGGTVPGRNQKLEPLIYGSNRLVVAAYFDSDNKRAIVDGGFTRLYYKWDSAGTDRYVVNAAAWLANIEYFGYEN